MLDLHHVVSAFGNALGQMAAIQKRLARNIAFYMCVTFSSLSMKVHIIALGDDTEINASSPNTNLQLRMYF